jgi:kynurenine formamidase
MPTIRILPTAFPGIAIALTVDDIHASEKVHWRVPEGSFAALWTDMYKDWDSSAQHFKRSPSPAWSLAAIKLLFDERKVTAIGHESTDTDTTDSMDSETRLLKQNHFQGPQGRSTFLRDFPAGSPPHPPRKSLFPIARPLCRRML